MRNVILNLLLVLLIGSCSQKTGLLHDDKGNEIDISQLKGKWIIVNYWATWCDNCLKEIPEMNHFYQHNPYKNVVLYGVNFDRLAKADLQQAIRQTHIAYPVVLEDPAQTWAINGIDVLPMTFIINPHGQVVKRIVGRTTEQLLLDTIHQLKQKN